MPKPADMTVTIKGLACNTCGKVYRYKHKAILCEHRHRRALVGFGDARCCQTCKHPGSWGGIGHGHSEATCYVLGKDAGFKVWPSGVCENYEPKPVDEGDGQ